MSAAPAQTLRTPSSHAESRRPAQVQALLRPPALVKARELAFLRFEVPDLDRTEDFLTDFGLRRAERSAAQLVVRGTGPSPCVYTASLGAKARFLGTAFTVSDGTDLDAVAHQCNGRRLDPATIPGGGRGIELTDPSGRSVWLLAGRPALAPLPVRAPLCAQTNTATHKPRVNIGVRAPIEPAAIVRLGHVAIQTADFPTMAQWYMRHLGLIPTDVQYLADGSVALGFFRLDLGDQPADHHAFVIVGGLEERYEHSAFEVVDLDAIGQGQQVLRANGHRHLWGIGRHVLGSQIFDYWYDPNGFQFEHYTDGDVFTADFETHYSPFDLGSVWAWGVDLPPAMRPRMSAAVLWSVIKLLLAKKLRPQRLKLFRAALDSPARPWM